MKASDVTKVSDDLKWVAIPPAPGANRTWVLVNADGETDFELEDFGEC